MLHHVPSDVNQTETENSQFTVTTVKRIQPQQYKIVLDLDAQPLSQLLQELRQAQFDEQMVKTGVEQVQLEFSNA